MPEADKREHGASAGASAGALAIETSGLTRVYKVGPQDVLARRGVSLRADAACFVALKGRSGNGKTTLLNCIGGLDWPTGGSVSIFGRQLLKMSERELTRWRREQVGFVFQSLTKGTRDPSGVRQAGRAAGLSSAMCKLAVQRGVALLDLRPVGGVPPGG
jgi:ABC-type glutathione transport system ATPase component